jgi:hypothetical protein
MVRWISLTSVECSTAAADSRSIVITKRERFKCFVVNQAMRVVWNKEDELLVTVI